MEIWKQLAASHKVLLLLVLSIALLFFIIPLIKKIRNKKLLKTVTSIKRGTPSERDLVLKLLKHGIPSQTIFHDLCVIKNNKEFAQIDVVIATTEGIIVIEVKDYSGWLFGSGNQSQWTQVLAYGKRKYRFYNPIKQNNSHINTLNNQLRQFRNIPFFSIIVFYGDCELKEINYVPKGTFLVKSHRIFEVLKQIKKNNEPAPFTDKREIIRCLDQAVKNGENIDNQEKHIENINEMLGKDRIID